MHFPQAQHLIDPGVDHLVGEGGEQRSAGQGLQQRPRQHDFSGRRAFSSRAFSGRHATAVVAGGAGEATITPAHLHEGTAIAHEGTGEVLAVQAVKQGQQRLQGHGRG